MRHGFPDGALYSEPTFQTYLKPNSESATDPGYTQMTILLFCRIFVLVNETRVIVIHDLVAHVVQEPNV
jgi:hypothetical protein